jgi:alkylmercury lyase
MAALGAALQMSQDELKRCLAQEPDAEFDRQGHLVGWGVTMIATRHRFQFRQQSLFPWCAYDTLLFPPALGETAQVQSTCPMTFVATPEGVVKELTPGTAVMSLIIPAERSDHVRSTFCEQSLFFQSEQAASDFLSTRPETVILSLEEAARLGWMIAEPRFTQTHQV